MGTSLDYLVSEVMRQLKGYVPAGGIVHFDVNIGILDYVGVYDAMRNSNVYPQNKITFDAVMPSEPSLEEDHEAD